MKVVIFGATGMIGSAALIECLAHPGVEAVLTVGRRATGVEHEKLTELAHPDLLDFAPVLNRLRGYDACLYCLGVSSTGMGAADYDRITRQMTIAAAEALLSVNADLSFCFVSAVGADSSEKGRVMWARVKGKTENQLRAMAFRGVWTFRPAFVQPLKGVRSRTAMYNAFYAVVGPLYPLISRVAPTRVATSEQMGLALIRAARDGAASAIVETAGIVALAAAEAEELAGR